MIVRFTILTVSLAVVAIMCSHFALAQDASPAQQRIKDRTLALDRYVDAQSVAYQWKIDATQDNAGTTKISATLTSGTWQGTTWQHAVRFYRPKPCPHADTAIVLVNGGSIGRQPGADIDMVCIAMAGMAGMPVVSVSQVPNQPLMGGKKEDALIAASWLKYLETGDQTWPLLFPMVNSAIKTMDCANEISRQEFGQPITKFVVTGASKRGWTSWLSAATEPRVIGIAPMVIDTLNFRKQMQDQKQKWGYYSEQIADYTAAGLVNVDNESPQETTLRKMMDPFEYLDRLTIPKLLVHGANDRYWRCDAMDNYWSDLLGPKNVLTIANAGHSLEGGEIRAATTISNFARLCATNQTLPKIDWKTNVNAAKRTMTLEVTTDQPITDFTFWVALSDDRDFREDQYVPRSPDASTGTTAVVTVEVPADQHVAVFADLTIGSILTKYTLSTGVTQPEF